MIELSVHSNIKDVTNKLSQLAYRQLPFATAKALTAIAKKVQPAEQLNMGKVLDRPTPFTVNSVGVKGATKSNPVALVFVKDIAAAYLAPYEFGGSNKLNSQALLKPVDMPTNQYGNLPKAKLAALKARSDIFIGAVKTRSGEVINGVWQREAATAVTVNTRTGKRRITRSGLNASGHLKLLIRFTDAHPVTQHLGWFDVAQRVVSSSFNAEFGKAMASAIASANR